MKILITSGGTEEAIDTVRSITNMSTGKLGAKLANKLSKFEDVEITFLSGERFKHPKKKENIFVERIKGVNDVFSFLERNNKKYDVIIHAMAISDYRVDGVYKMMSNGELDEMNVDGKISSNEDCMFVKLEKTIKIVDYIKGIWGFKGLLISFKLLDGVSKEELLDIGNKQLLRTKSDYVVCNDLSDIKEEEHKAYIINEKGIIAECETKKEIAEAIIKVIHHDN